MDASRITALFQHTPMTKFWKRPRKRERGSDGGILILTPMKDAALCVEGYCRGLRTLTYPHDRLSLGVLESDSSDATFAEISRAVPSLRREFRSVTLVKRDFGYRLPVGVHRSAPAVQAERRAILARSRNHLLFAALRDEDWVLWLDVDVIEYPADVIERMLAAGKDIVQPHCVLDYGGPTFDRNAWLDRGRRHMEDVRSESLVRLDSVGGTMLLVRADLHRDGLIFPAYFYGRASDKARGQEGEIETEGFGIMAHDMGYECWGMPTLEIRHGRW
jgi:hypothetical protein